MKRPIANDYHTYESLNNAWQIWADIQKGKRLEVKTLYTDGTFDCESFYPVQKEVFYTNRFLEFDKKSDNSLTVLVDTNHYSDTVYTDGEPMTKANFIKAYKAWLTSRKLPFKSVAAGSHT